MRQLLVFISCLVVFTVFVETVKARSYTPTVDNKSFKTVNSVPLKLTSPLLWFFNCSFEVPTHEGDYTRIFNEGHWRKNVYNPSTSSFEETRAYYRGSSKVFAIEQVATLVSGALDQQSWEVRWRTPVAEESALMFESKAKTMVTSVDSLLTVYAGVLSGHSIVSEYTQVLVDQRKQFRSLVYTDDPTGHSLPVRSWCSAEVVEEHDQPAPVQAAFSAFDVHHVLLLKDPIHVSYDGVYVYRFPGTHDVEEPDLFYREDDVGIHWTEYFGYSA